MLQSGQRYFCIQVLSLSRARQVPAQMPDFSTKSDQTFFFDPPSGSQPGKERERARLHIQRCVLTLQNVEKMLMVWYVTARLLSSAKWLAARPGSGGSQRKWWHAGGLLCPYAQPSGARVSFALSRAERAIFSYRSACRATKPP